MISFKIVVRMKVCQWKSLIQLEYNERDERMAGESGAFSEREFIASL